MGASAGWRTTADSILASFGDVVRKAVVSVKSNGNTYDTVTGTMTQTQVNHETVCVETKFKSGLYNREKYNDQDRMFLVRGSDFVSSIIPVESYLTLYDEAGTTIKDTYVVIDVSSSDAGTSSYYYLHVRKASKTVVS